MKSRDYIFSLALVALLSCNGEKQVQTTEKPNVKKAETTIIQSDEKGIVNYINISFDEALAKAKEENKQLFIDCSTTTCGPCRMMRKNVLSKKRCSDYINENFIALHINMDEGEGVEIAEKYNVGIFPTYMILNPDGTKCGEVIGADKNVNRFIEKIKNAAKGISEAM
ncbi:MAG: thioredoxin family protein [Bacteroidaceae bacterium]|nr:thioredoxin family protein [Bacteroidaceae bacterium]